MNQRLPVIVFLGMVAVLATHCIYDPDVWYHLAVGDHILTTHQVQHTNLFSFTYPQHPWIDVYWLYDCLLAALWRLGGSLFVIALKVLLNLVLAALVVFGLRDRRQQLTGGETTVLMLAWLVMLPRLSDRPELLSYVLLAAVLVLIRQGRLWWCIPIQIVWANVHSLYYLGPVLLLLYAVATRQARVLPVVLATGLACLVSPYGWNNLRVAGELMHTLRVLGNQVQEFPSPFHPRAWASGANSLLFLIWVVGGGLLLLRSWSRQTLFDGFIILLSVGLAMRTQRAVPLAVLCSLPAVLLAVRQLPATNGVLRWVAVGFMGLIAGDFLAGTHYLIRSPRGDLTFGIRVYPRNFPNSVVDLLTALPPSARVANVHFHTGGFLICAFAGARPVFIDPRLEAYPREFIAAYDASLQSAQRFSQFTDRFRVTHALIIKDNAEACRLARWLAGDKGWRRVSGNEQAELYERTP